MKKKIPFNNWSQERIKEGRKFCTSRHTKYEDDPRVRYISDAVTWGFIKKYLWQMEGANSPEELQEVIESIYKRKVTDAEPFYFHIGDFR